MSRRLILILVLCFAVIAAVAAFPWGLTSKGPEHLLEQQLRKIYGIDFTVKGETTLAILPMPRIKIEHAEITGLNNRLSIKGATLRGNISLLSLLRDQLELSDLSISNAQTVIDLRETDESFWIRLGAWLQLRSVNAPIPAVKVIGNNLRILRSSHPDIILSTIDGEAYWQGSSSPLRLSGQAEWNGEIITLQRSSFVPGNLLTGKSSPYTLEMATSDSALSLAGDIRLDRQWNVSLSGKSTFTTKSMRRFAAWSDFPIPASPLIESFAIDGAFTTDKNLLSWPTVKILLGDNKLEGSLSFRFGSKAHSVSGTLASDNLDVTAYVEAAQALYAQQPTDISFKQLNRSDLDVRLSASAVRIRKLELSDMALGLIIKPDRLEVSLGRASLDNGSVKGRFLLTGSSDIRELKLQTTVNDLNLAKVNKGLGVDPIISGALSGSLSLEGQGHTLNETLQMSHGKATFFINNGVLEKLDIPATVKLAEQPTKELPAPVSGTTPFKLASFGLHFDTGIGTLSDGTIQMSDARAIITGSVSLADRMVALNALIASALNAPAHDVSITAHGPWEKPAMALRPHEKEKEQPTE
ncbi:AsmA-like C-terminal region-containing protein [Microvirga sp. W0021]|uniref:AsmA-like C-terminal region-containing protein n=1 Tax=Hohaiivirga grylli TaxID=3133970 RepID=A0ABV0BHW1_9HYPH